MVDRARINALRAQVREAFGMAFAALWANRLRSTLTILGVFIGVTTVVGLISLIAGLNKYVANAFATAGTDTFFISRMNFISSDYSDFITMRHRPDLTYEDSRALMAECPSVDYTAPRYVAIRDVTYRGKTVTGVFIMGTTEEFQQMEGLKIRHGRFITNEEVSRSKAVCGLGSEVADVLYGRENPVGTRLKVGGNPVMVMGDAEPLGASFGENRDNTLILPITTFEKMFGSRGMRRAMAITVRPRTGIPPDAAIDEVITVMRRRHRLKPEQENDFEIMTQAAMMKAFTALTAALFVVIVAVGSVSLLVGGVGIMNIMLVSVTERTREIGVRKAVGARRNDIMLQFLIEAVVLSALGGVLGVGGGTVLAYIVAIAIKFPPTLSWGAVVLGVVFSTAVGIFFGIYPARRAASLEPIRALRYE